MTVHIDFYTVRPEVYRYAKIDHAMNFLPSWYKDLSVKNYDSRCPGGVQYSMKGCYGFRELFKRSLIMPLWSDVNIFLGKAGTDLAHWNFSDACSSITVNTERDYGSFLDATKIQSLKFESPWYAFTKSDVNFCYVQPTWNTMKYSDTLHVLPGLMDFKHQSGTHVNMALSRKPEDKTLELKHGMPLVHIMPLTEEKVKIKHHLADEKEMFNRVKNHGVGMGFPIFGGHLSFLGWMNKMKKLPRG